MDIDEGYRVSFWFRIRRQGEQIFCEVLFKLFGQKCNFCNPSESVNEVIPLFFLISSLSSLTNDVFYFLVWIPATTVVSSWNWECHHVPFQPSHRSLLWRKKNRRTTSKYSFLQDQHGQQQPFTGSSRFHSLSSLSIRIMYLFPIWLLFPIVYLTVSFSTNFSIWNVLLCPVFVVFIYTFTVIFYNQTFLITK